MWEKHSAASLVWRKLGVPSPLPQGRWFPGNWNILIWFCLLDSSSLELSLRRSRENLRSPALTVLWLAVHFFRLCTLVKKSQVLYFPQWEIIYLSSPPSLGGSSASFKNFGVRQNLIWILAFLVAEWYGEGPLAFWASVFTFLVEANPSYIEGYVMARNSACEGCHSTWHSDGCCHRHKPQIPRVCSALGVRALGPLRVGFLRF